MNSNNYGKQRNTKLKKLVDELEKLEQLNSKNYPKTFFLDSKQAEDTKGFSVVKRPRVTINSRREK